MSIRKILIAVDDQPLSVRAAELGAELARALGGEMALIHVNAQGYPGDTGIPPQQLIAQAQEESKRLLTGFRERLSLPASTLEFVQRGTPAETIAKAAREWGADLIVIGSHGRTGVRRALLGSVAEGVMRNAPCPVLVARTPITARPRLCKFFSGRPSRLRSRKGAIITGYYSLVCCPELAEIVR